MVTRKSCSGRGRNSQTGQCVTARLPHHHFVFIGLLENTEYPPLSMLTCTITPMTSSHLSLRPQHIIIINASTIKRLAVNFLVKFASVFSSNKIFQRLRFGNIDDVTDRCMPKDSLPVTHGGPSRGSTTDWVIKRLKAFPMPPKDSVDALADGVAKVKVAPKVVAL